MYVGCTGRRSVGNLVSLNLPCVIMCGLSSFLSLSLSLSLHLSLSLSLSLHAVPTVSQIQNFFRQPNIYSVITDLNVSRITLENRSVMIVASKKHNIALWRIYNVGLAAWVQVYM